MLVPSNSDVLNLIPTAAETLPVASLVKSPNSPTVYLIDGSGRKIPVPTFALTTEFGISGYSVRSDAALAPYTSTPSPLTVAVTCQGNTHIAGGGKLWKVPNSFGLPTTALDATTCATFQQSTESVTQGLFLRNPSNSDIYNITSGKKTYMATWAQVIAANNRSQTVVLVPSNSDVLNLIPTH